jgi:branched-chain amino acid transport system permease protein
VKYARLVVALALIGLLAGLGPHVLPEYWVRVLIVLGINIILVSSLGLSNGFTGVFSLGHPGFVALGAYVSGILTLELTKKGAYLPDLPGFLAGVQLPFLPATLIAGVFCALVAVVIGIPLMRLSGNYVSVATLGFLVIVNVVLVNAEQFTRGSRTFTGIPPYTDLGWVAGWAVVTLLVLSRVAYSPLGRAMRATRDDPIAAQAVGIHILPARLMAFALGAFFAGVGGALYGHYLVSFSPATFYVAMLVQQLTMLVLGGQASLTGAVVGVSAITLLSEVLRNLERGFSLGSLQVPAVFGASQIALGFIFILVMVYRPQGLLGDRELPLVTGGRVAKGAGPVYKDTVGGGRT